MKTIISLFIMITFLSCCSDSTNRAMTIEAETYMKGAMVEADKWLKVLDENGYTELVNHKYTPPFDKIMNDTMRIKEIKNKVKWFEQEFGEVNERDFYGAHVIINDKLLTYVPDKMSSFKQIKPQKLGLNEISDLYKNHIEGTYVFLMYESKPTKKEKAEELVLLWLDKNKWHIVDYYIDKEI